MLCDNAGSTRILVKVSVPLQRKGWTTENITFLNMCFFLCVLNDTEVSCVFKHATFT